MVHDIIGFFNSVQSWTHVCSYLVWLSLLSFKKYQNMCVWETVRNQLQRKEMYHFREACNRMNPQVFYSRVKASSGVQPYQNRWWNPFWNITAQKVKVDFAWNERTNVLRILWHLASWPSFIIFLHRFCKTYLLVGWIGTFHEETHVWGTDMDLYSWYMME